MAEQLLARYGAAALRAHVASANSSAANVPLPAYAANFLVQLRLAHGIPFSYLVPDEAMLRDESIRFFTVDQAWFDAAMAGALAVGTAGTRDTEHVARALPVLHAAVRDAVPMMADVRSRRTSHHDVAAHVRSSVATTVAGAAAVPDPGGTPPITGFLLRSALVAGWPGFSVRAFTTTDIADGADPSRIAAELCVPILRMELLAPSVLLVLFAGTPQLVWIEEPHHAVQLGVDHNGGIDVITPVNSDGTEKAPPAAPVPVPMRAGGSNVIDVHALATALGASDSTALATQLLRPPYRVRFVAGG